jgi:hypothetical protein
LDNAYKVIESSKSKIYFLSGDTCIGLAVKVAEAAGLSVPSNTGFITQSPSKYLEDISKANPKFKVRCQKGITS